LAGKLLARHVHGDERIAVNVGVDGIADHLFNARLGWADVAGGGADCEQLARPRGKMRAKIENQARSMFSFLPRWTAPIVEAW